MKTWRDTDIEQSLTDLRWPPVHSVERKQAFLNTYQQRAAGHSAQRDHVSRLALGWAAICCAVLLVIGGHVVSGLNTIRTVAERVLVPTSAVAGPLSQPEQHGKEGGEGMGPGGTTEGWRLPITVQPDTTVPLLSRLLADNANHTATVTKSGFTFLIDVASGQILGVTSVTTPDTGSSDIVSPSSPPTASQIAPALDGNTFFRRIGGKVIGVTPIPTYIDKSSTVRPASVAVLVSVRGGWKLSFVIDTVTNTFLGASWSTHVTGFVLSSWRGAYIIGK